MYKIKNQKLNGNMENNLILQLNTNLPTNTGKTTNVLTADQQKARPFTE